MVVVFDASFLIPLLDPQAQGKAADRKIEHLVATLDKGKTKIIVPTPALSEVLIGAGEAAPKYLEILSRSSRFKIAPFGERAAVEAAARHREAMEGGNKKEGSVAWSKVKFDRQIVAIARVEGADCIYSDDTDIRRLVGDGLKVITRNDLEPPPPEALDLFANKLE